MNAPNSVSHPSSLSALARRSTLTVALMLVSACLPEIGLGMSDDDIDPAPDQLQALLPPSSASPSEIATMGLGDGTSCAATPTGQVKCWGRNEQGQLGQANVIDIGDDETPDTIPFIDLGGLAQAVYTNGEQTFALLQDGSVRAWGANAGFELGLMHTESLGDDETPASTTVVTSPRIGGWVVQLAVGGDFACARLDDGAVRCWGANDFGQLGRGHTDRIGDDEDPGAAGSVDLGGPAVDVAAGAHHACAVLVGGAVRCWGLGNEGQLGYGDPSAVGDDETPASAGDVDLGGIAVELALGGTHSCVRLASGAIRCWGHGLRGQLGHGVTQNVGDDEVPASMGDVPVGGVVVGLAAGWQHTCALLDTGSLRCWGAGTYGSLGYGTTDDIGDNETPMSVGDVDLGPWHALAVFAGPTSRSTCARLSDGALRCWGDNDAGQLGYGHTKILGDEPTEVPGDLSTIDLLGDDDDS